MKKSVLYSLWAVLYCLCVGFGFVENATGFGKFLLVVLGIVFFLPPFLLAYRARLEKDRRTLQILGLVSICVLALALVLLVLNLLSVNFSSEVGLTLHVLLVMFTAPMVCIRYWALGLFLWACLLMVTGKKLRLD